MQYLRQGERVQLRFESGEQLSAPLLAEAVHRVLGESSGLYVMHRPEHA